MLWYRNWRSFPGCDQIGLGHSDIGVDDGHGAGFLVRDQLDVA